MRELNEFSCISEGGMIQQRIKQELYTLLQDDYNISCKINSCYFSEQSTRIICDVIGDNFLIEIGRWEYWEKGIADLLYKNEVVKMKFKVLILYIPESASRITRSTYDHAHSPAIKAIKQAAKLQGISVLNANEIDYIKLAESITRKIPTAKC